MLLFIDNYDSFTYNIVQYFAELGQEVVVRRNDDITLEEIEALKPQYLVIGPGPCSPKEVFERFRKNDQKAIALIERSARAIANLIADLKISLDMQKVVVGGSVGLAEGYLPLIHRFLDEMPEIYRCEIESARFEQDAGLVGAAYWVKDILLTQVGWEARYG